MNNRIKEILEHYKISASKFAETLNTQPSSISHILSGRNKPSVDLLEKIALNFNRINMSWLVTGNGDMLTKENIPYFEDELTAPPLPHNIKLKKEEKSEDLFSQINSEKLTSNTQDINNVINHNERFTNTANRNNIEQIVFFYKDGSFKSYKP